MANRHWSTNDVPSRDKFAYWREAVCEAVMNVATENPADDDFRGEIACTGYGDLRFASFTSSPHQVIRRPAHIRRSGHAHYLISLQRSGVSRMQQCGVSCELQPGDIGIVDGARPFSVTFPHRVDRIVAVIPAGLLHSRAPWLLDRPIHLMPRADMLHPVLKMHIERLAGPHCGSQSEAELLSDNICNLVAVLTARRQSEHKASLARLSDIEQMRAFMHRHLGDPGLAPQALADHFRVSVRTVHKRFEQAETTFRQSLLAQRLEACRRALTEPRCDRMTVSQIAFGFGFSDLSHFTKAFRARYGMPPGRFRVEAARLRKGGAPDPGFPLARK